MDKPRTRPVRRLHPWLAAALANEKGASAALSDVERESCGTSARPIRLCQRSGTSNTQAALRRSLSNSKLIWSLAPLLFLRRRSKRHVQGKINCKMSPNLITMRPTPCQSSQQQQQLFTRLSDRPLQNLCRRSQHNKVRRELLQYFADFHVN